MLNNLKKRITSLRKLMHKNHIDCYILPHNDEYLSEYVPPNKERLNWICGFSGSAGSLLVTFEKLFLYEVKNILSLFLFLFLFLFYLK